jgi:hypothetical protein
MISMRILETNELGDRKRAALARDPARTARRAGVVRLAVLASTGPWLPGYVTGSSATTSGWRPMAGVGLFIPAFTHVCGSKSTTPRKGRL